LVIPVDIIDCGNIFALNSCAVGLEAKATRRSYPALKALWKLRRRFTAVTEGIFRIAGLLEIFDRDTMGQCYRING
jgi:diacylglycerol kinase family enzyme